MVRLIQYMHKAIIIALCLALIAVIMIGASHFIDRQQSELSDNLQEITHQLVKQSSYSLAPLIYSYTTEEDNSQQITDVLQRLSKQPWIIDISVYQLNGALIAQAGETINVRERLALDKKNTVAKNTLQLVEKIDLAESPVGFIRLTIDPGALQLDQSGTYYTTKMIWFMLLLAVAIGFVLALALSRWQTSTVNNKSAKPNEKTAPSDSPESLTD
jgi:membrane protein